MLKGLRTVVYRVTDLDQGKAWWSGVLGQVPYFDQPFYVGYNVGGYELGLVPDSLKPTEDDARPVTYWAVDDVEAAYQRLLDAGCIEFHPVQEVGDGIRLAAAENGFGHVVGVIYNPYFTLPTAG